nr:hypothetical protein [Tanacetum cinerariifolium]
MWSLDHLSVSVPSRGLYKTKPPSPRVIKTLIQVPRQGQETRTKNKKTIVVGGHKDHVSAYLCHMLYCIERSTPHNLAFLILKRMEKTRFKPKDLLPYGMLLTRKPRMSVRQLWKRKTSTPKSSPPPQNDSPPLPLRVYLQSPSPPSYNPLRDQMINQLHNISTILDLHNNQSNAYIHAPPSPPPPQIHPPSYAQVKHSLKFLSLL